MKGIVFSEFVEMVEDTYSPEIADQMIVNSNLPSGGAYTSVGFYDHQELLLLVASLGAITNISCPDLMREFGRHLLGKFVLGHSVFFNGMCGAFDFLESVNDKVHTEVLKLSPDAQLPHFKTSRVGNTLEMIYSSTRPFADLAEGLILGSFDHFKEMVTIERNDSKNGDFYVTQFLMHLKKGAIK